MTEASFSESESNESIFFKESKKLLSFGWKRWLFEELLDIIWPMKLISELFACNNRKSGSQKKIVLFLYLYTHFQRMNYLKSAYRTPDS